MARLANIGKGLACIVAGAAVGGAGRFLQFRVELSAPEGSSPAVTAVGFTHSGRLPVADSEVAH